MTPKQAVQQARANNALGYEQHRSTRGLMASLCKEVDQIIGSLWQAAAIPNADLIAVGGYGRGELSPYSDIDLLVLIDDGVQDADIAQPLAQFVNSLWDAGLDAGHSVRTLDECMQQAKDDLTVATALLESRLISGRSERLGALHRRWHGEMDRSAFAQGKLLERRQRHHRYQDTPYSLEPNIKESPGGLRDLQVIQWICIAFELGHRWQDLVDKDLLTTEEAKALETQQRVLQTLRAQLHLAAGRREDRLVFDLQNAVAQRMGIKATNSRRASEMLMQRYYRAAKVVWQVSAILLANLEPTLLPNTTRITRPSGAMPDLPTDAANQARPIDEDFCITRGLLDLQDDKVFERSPDRMLEAFVLMCRHSSRRGMTARTLRALWNARDQINADFRQNPKHKDQLLQIFKEGRGMVHSLRILNNLGLLGRMLPVFRKIVGQMQHDLFHVYTVDQHILQVIRNLRRLTMHEHAHELPSLTALMSDFGEPWRLYLAALFHDIAKGRGGDHSELGEHEVARFAKAYGLDQPTADLLQFLVAQHLTMSTIAQKHDLADPSVIESFAKLVQTPERLTALYLLTVSDIRGTSPKVWNNWKARLLESLYQQTMAYLKAETPQAARDAIGEKALMAKREEASRILLLYGRDLEQAQQFWADLDLGYFLRHDAADMAWHARMLAHRLTVSSPVVFARLSPSEDGLQVVVYQPDAPALFTKITAYFDQENLPVLEAQIHTTKSGYVLDAFLVDHRDFPGHHREMISLVEAGLAAHLGDSQGLSRPSKGRVSRQSKHFPMPPEVDLTPDHQGLFFNLAVTASDRPGLLYTIAHCLSSHQIEVQSAKITTLGERVEDVFLVSGPMLSTERQQVSLERDLLQALSS
ncbi:MAG: [protein-PII] uridylyltransferase [Burkholderiaceae bacterium]